ncbi:SDR family oxidoreductase [Streptomyces morookaense]|uniref:SDR family oxidoreductase n=1 Tax=Streptomyces morookaense TaxID=1970 RepID=A0A7Y7E8V4_STRMO|nr:SDR family oxidoreductase [Streptomyces morookaense]NVK80403.1 SDR family oxidoreductase [Streptomyces morookaense]GHF14269.1 short-chain dehydrogenase [Streptomyces morookaense]
MGALQGKTALVTGSSRGIGRSTAEELARQGALVAVHYGSNEAAARETVAAIEAEGGRAFPVRANLAEPGAVTELYAAFDTGLKELGAEPGLDILVNNAADGTMRELADVTPEHFDDLVAVNAKAPLFVIQQGLERMRDNGRIINLTSAVTRHAFPDAIVYAMTKGAVDVMTLALAQQLGSRGITVNCVAPGFVETDMNAAIRQSPEAREQLAAFSVFRRMGVPQDIADVIAFLASDAGRWITGQRIDATGGSKL